MRAKREETSPLNSSDFAGFRTVITTEGAPSCAKNAPRMGRITRLRRFLTAALFATFLETTTAPPGRARPTIGPYATVSTTPLSLRKERVFEKSARERLCFRGIRLRDGHAPYGGGEGGGDARLLSSNEHETRGFEHVSPFLVANFAS